MEGDESQPREGWMVRTPPAPVPRRRARLSREPTISTLDGSRTPPGAVAGVHRKWGHVYEWLRVLHVSPHLQQVRLRPDGSFGDSGV